MADFVRNWRDYQKLDDCKKDNVEEDNSIASEDVWAVVSDNVNTGKNDESLEQNENIEVLFRSKKWKEFEAKPAVGKKVFWIVSGIFIVPIVFWIISSVWGYFRNYSTDVPVFVPFDEVSSSDIYTGELNAIYPITSSLPVGQYNHCVANVGSVKMVNLSTGEKLLEYNSDSPRYLASISKLMTAYVVYNEYDMDEMITTVQDRAYYQSEIGLQEGEFISVNSALDVLLVLSGNDVGYMLADNYRGGYDEFVNKMNEIGRAIELGSTKFIDPNGIEEKDAYSTADDAILLLNLVLNTKSLRDRLEMTTVKIPVYNRSGDLIRYIEPDYNNNFLKNRNELLISGEVTGGKTGTNIIAKQNLVSYVETEQGVIAFAILGAENREEVGRCLLQTIVNK